MVFQEVAIQDSITQGVEHALYVSMLYHSVQSAQVPQFVVNATHLPTYILVSFV